MSDWKQDVTKRIENLKILLKNPGAGLPPFLLERLTTNLARLSPSDIEGDSLRAFVRGAFRAISDAGDADDDDPIISELLGIYEAIPSEG